MAAIMTAHVNLLEAATVTLTAGAAAAGFPVYRVHDRDIGRMFVGSAAATTTIHANQGAAAVAVDRLLIPDGHNLAGETVTLEHSPDNSAWTDALGAPFVAAAGDINKSWASIARQYWRLTVTSPAAAPALAELWLTATTTWTRSPSRPGGAQEAVHNVTVAVTAAGRVRFEVNGPSLRQRNYRLSNMTSAQATTLETLWTAFAGAHPFWIADHDGTWIYGRIVAPPGISETAPGTYSAAFNFLEVPA